jgi:serine protease Do
MSFRRSLSWSLLLLATLSPALRAEDDQPPVDLASLSSGIQKLLPDCRAATVCVLGRFGVGSGVVVTTNGFVLTAGHVCGQTNEPVTVYFEDGSTAKGRTLGMSAFTDTGLIRLEGDGPWPARPMAAVNQSREGDWLFALGFPEGRFGQEERGVVLRVGRLLAKRPLVLQTDCKLIGGDSGGPLFNLLGEVVGIHSRISVPTEFNFHAPVEAFHREWKLLVDSREIKPTGSFLGVRMERVAKGVRITAVVADSAAAESGLRVGDVITHVEDEPTQDPDEAIVLIRTKAIDEPIKLDLLRRGEPMTYIIRLGRWPGMQEETRESRRKGSSDE